MLGNPYTPGAGCMPPFLAGRDNILDAAQVALERLKGGFPQRPTLYYGLRGVGKTALLNAIEQFADNLDILNTHIEATEEKQFIKRIVTALNKFAKSISVGETAKALKTRIIKLAESFTVTYNLTGNELSASLSPDDIITSGDLVDDLTELLTSIGKLAQRTDNALCLFIDEIQFVSKDHSRALVSALHRCNQLRLPITICCAGLPKAVETLNKSCSYSERMFEYIQIDRLSDEEAQAAAAEPAKELGINFEQKALDEIVNVTLGYPYFIQEYCSVIWDGLKDDTSEVLYKDVVKAKSTFLNRLDRGFFEARYSRSSASEKRFMLAMAECSKLPCRIGEVAERMGKDVPQVSPYRATLIDKGIIYAPSRGEVDFTVPLFKEYLARVTTDE